MQHAFSGGLQDGTFGFQRRRMVTMRHLSVLGICAVLATASSAEAGRYVFYSGYGQGAVLTSHHGCGSSCGGYVVSSCTSTCAPVTCCEPVPTCSPCVSSCAPEPVRVQSCVPVCQTACPPVSCNSPCVTTSCGSPCGTTVSSGCGSAGCGSAGDAAAAPEDAPAPPPEDAPAPPPEDAPAPPAEDAPAPEAAPAAPEA